MEINYVKGDIITLSKEGKFDVIAHGNNCFCNQDRGAAKHFSDAYGTNNPKLYRLEDERFKGDINKLGQIEYRKHVNNIDQLTNRGDEVFVVNCYTQYKYGKSDSIHVDYDALRLCLRKMNHRFKGKNIGLVKIGSDLAGGDWGVIERIIRQEFKDAASVTVVIYERKRD